MNNINKTLYIPLYGKALVSKKNIILYDKKAEDIWEKEKIELKGKSKSKWLAYYMGMRSRVFDDWILSKIDDDCIVIHLGCGLDSRVLRVKHTCKWIDIDFESVIAERKKYYEENDTYQMIASDIREPWYLQFDSNCRVVIIMEGVSMYLQIDELKCLFENICKYFKSVDLLMDYYTEKAAKLSKIKNPINDVGVFDAMGFDDPKLFETDILRFVSEHDITPSWLIDELKGLEKIIFKKLYAGNLASGLYKMVEYRSK